MPGKFNTADGAHVNDRAGCVFPPVIRSGVLHKQNQVEEFHYFSEWTPRRNG